MPWEFAWAKMARISYPRITFPFFGLYGASKFALEALTESYRYELSQSGVDVVLVQPSTYPTNMFASAQRPADATRANGYGVVGGIPDKMVGSLLELFQSENAPDPHDVAEAIARIVAAPSGSRAARVVVGKPFGTDALNAQSASVQGQVLAGLGLSQLADARLGSAGA